VTAPAPLEASADRVLDARGLRCPLPVIRLAALLGDLPAGTEVVLLATDPAARSDVAAFCRMRGHELLLAEDHRPPQEAQYTAYRVRRGA
jgi:tRNA 2-thiouridine synthesizing protein A